MKKGYLKLLAGLLVVALVSTTCILVIRGRESPDGPIRGIHKDTVLDSTEPIVPDRPYTTREQIQTSLSPMQQYLTSEDISYASLEESPGLEDQILNADELTNLASSQTEIQGLKALRENLVFLLNLHSQGTVTDDALPVDKLERLKAKLDRLFDPGSLIGQVKPGNSMKGTWTTPDRVVLRWTPEKDWIPEKGYNLYRVLDGQAELIAQGLGSEDAMPDFGGNIDLREYVQSLFTIARLDASKMKILGLKSLDEFNRLVYDNAVPAAILTRFSGELDFKLEKDFMFSIPGEIIKKMPTADAAQTTGLHLKQEIRALAVPLVKLDRFKLVNTPVLPNRVDLSEKDLVLYDLVNARKTLVTMAFTNEVFANNSGFGYEDHLEDLNIPLDEAIEYVVVPRTGSNEALTPAQIASGARGIGSFAVSVKYGFEILLETPTGLDGYGADNIVSLRWKAPDSAIDKGLVSGYYIERKGEGDSEFRRINETPVAISYTQQAEGILCEVPIFFMDYDVQNGAELVYRIQAVDIFGRLSEFSAPLEVGVYKVQPPLRPVLDNPTLSTTVSALTPTVTRQLIGMNKKIQGAILPIASSSPDTEIFVIYRSKAYGTGSFSAPEELVRIQVGPYLTSPKPIISTNRSKATFVIRPKLELQIDTLYYDNTIEPGHYYKYWISAVDSWGNESEWSDSRVIGYPLSASPSAPQDSALKMRTNDLLLAATLNPPGFLQRFTTVAGLSLQDVPNLSGTGGTTPGSTSPGGVSSSLSPQIGFSLSEAVRINKLAIPKLLDLELNNLPKSKDVHDIIALTNSDLAADGTARFAWYHYTGEGLLGYAVYRAYVDGLTPEALGQMTKEKLLESFQWSLVENDVQVNQITDMVEKKDGRIYLYFVFLIPQETPGPNLDQFAGFLPAGWIQFSWQRPGDPQVSGFRVYRASVPYFSENEDFSKLEWTLVGDSLKYTTYSEKVDQTYAHYYYFKVTSVSVWGVESGEGSIARYRVPATAPPQAPSMLVPFSRKAINEVNWMGVPHASKYVIYRRQVPRIQEADLQAMFSIDQTLFNTLFNLPLVNGIYRVDPVKLKLPKDSLLPDIKGIAPINLSTQAPFVPGAGTLKTFQLTDPTTMLKNIGTIKTSSKQEIFNYIQDKYGVLALMPYNNLSRDLAATVVWERIGEINIALGDDSSGLMQYLDTDAQFGETYLYTVEAWNDDELGSGCPPPVSVFTRKGSAFPPITNLQRDAKGKLSWNSAKDPNLSVKESNEHIAGYLVYRSNTRDGGYYQASPLLDKNSTSFTDVNANLAADNWYKVRVVDTAGYISDFSEPILITNKPIHFEKDFRKLIKGVDLSYLHQDECGLALNRPGDSKDDPPPSLTIVKPPQIIVPIIPTISEQMTIQGFVLTEVSLKGKLSGRGEAILNLRGGYAVPVNITIDEFDKTTITRGIVTAKEPFALGNTGIFIKDLEVSTRIGKARVNGYVMGLSGNLFGDLYRLDFANSELMPNGVVHIFNIPVFHYQDLTFTQVERISLNFGGKGKYDVFLPPGNLSYGNNFINLHNCLIETSLGLENMDNKGLELKSDMVGFDQAGLLSGTFELNGYGYMRTVIPAGLGIGANKANLVYAGGNVDASKSQISGKIFLPFTTFEDTIPTAIPSHIGTLAPVNLEILGRLSKGSSLSTADTDLLNMGMMYLAQVTQSNSLLVIPRDQLVLEQKSSLSFSVANWDGKGFIIEDAVLSPALIPLYDPQKTDQKDAEMGITPYRVAVDLRRDQAYTGAAPPDTKTPDWLGIVIKNGNVSLPPKYVQTNDNQRVRFNLTPGELLYDQNGFCYQSQAYTPDGVPVNFGDRLGGFTDVIVYNIVIDLYNNIANLEIEGSVAVPLFHQRVGVKLYKDKDSGEFVCTVSETAKFDPAGDGKLKIRILGGYLDELGMHLDGTLDFSLENSMDFADVQFNGLIVPADMALLAPGGEDSIYGRALFDKPYLIKFHDFPMEIRAMSLVSGPMMLNITQAQAASDYKGPYYSTTLTLWGGMQLSDNMALNAASDTDRIVVEKLCHQPTIKYEDSKSLLSMTFEDFADIKGVGTPILTDNEEGLVEYDTSDMEMAFNSASSLLPCKDLTVNARIGYDKRLNRSYFAIAIHYEGPPGIPLGIAEINIMNGMLGYNMDLDKNADGTYKITADSKSFINMVDSMAVNRTPGGNYFFAVACNMTLGYNELKLGELRNVYMVVEKGPSVEMGGYYYGPASVEALATGKGLKEMGYARVGYYHRQELFKFSLSLYDAGMYGFTVNGDLGFEMSPAYWELRIGYPNTLVANAGPYEVGFGLAIKSSELEDYVKAKAQFGYDTGDVTIGIVYVRGYITVGGEGEYNFTNDSLHLHVFLRGGVEGGVKAMGKRFNVISVMLVAEGDLIRTHNWQLSAHARLYYHVDLWLSDISGSVGWHITTTF